MAAEKIKLTYFNFEGVAEKVRLAFVLGGIDFEDERVALDDWEPLKPKTKFGQLPMMQIGDAEPVAQSGAMLRYAGQLGGLYPLEHLLRIEEVIGLEEDMARAIMPSMYVGRRPQVFGYPEDMPQADRTKLQLQLRSKLMEPNGDIPRLLGYLEDMLSKVSAAHEGKEVFMVTNRPTIADCQVIPRLRQLRNGVLDGVPSTVLDSFTKISAYYDRFHAIPAVKAHYERFQPKK